ncbi:MAG: double-strand break repair protein AddB [Acetobacteraceae bacterium]
MNLFTIPAHIPFLDAIAAEWLDASASGSPMAAADGLILLPTRRAARSLADAFLRAADGRALLLPRITAIGALDEAPLTLAGALDLPPAIEPARQLAALSRLILAMGGRDGAPRTADRAWRLAEELAVLMDEAERAGIDLATTLPDAADPAFAQHWARTLAFLRIVTEHWPGFLAEQGVMNPAARQVALIDAQAASWERDRPAYRVLIAGATAAIPAVARLAGVVARLPTGSVVLAGLDQGLPEAAWVALEPSHPQAGLAALLRALGATREDVRGWTRSRAGGVPASRSEALRRALLPGAALADDWTDPRPADIAGLSRLEAADQQEEAASIALILRAALEAPGARAALVTPDRALAGRVTAELGRWGIVADDSAGEALAETPPAVFLRLLARAVADELAPVALLALLKHPLAGAGLTPAACRTGARALELACLRGPRPGPGISALRAALRKVPDAAALDMLTRLEECIAPALRFGATLASAPGEAMAGLIEAAERLARTELEAGPARLWAGEEGEAVAAHLGAVLEALDLLPAQPRDTMAGLLDAVLAGAPAVRSRRALRGRTGAEHPRIFIWGLLEARLQTVDVLVLGGLTEGVWPPSTDPGPWLSRPMRARMKLPSPEAMVGQAAHDFVSAVCAAPVVVLSCPRRLDGAPTVPARWLTRIEMFLAGRGAALPRHPASGWARMLDQPVALRPVPPPSPRPPVSRRPRQLSVTAIETWLRDPYAIHARHILRLVPLAEIEQDTDAADYGSMVHAGLHRFLDEAAGVWPEDARERLRAHLMRALFDAGLRTALANWWAPRLERIADWIAALEASRRAEIVPSALSTEVSGRWELKRPGGLFTLTGRADRIERRADGQLAILDYKTGSVPGQSDVEAGLAPQLPLEAAMARAGAFGAAIAGETAELAYWHITGGFEPGKVRALFKNDAAAIAKAAREAGVKLGALIDAFDDPARCYLSQPRPGRAPRFSDYGQLARVAEWAAASEGDET